jgi:hypothetical protein
MLLCRYGNCLARLPSVQAFTDGSIIHFVAQKKARMAGKVHWLSEVSQISLQMKDLNKTRILVMHSAMHTNKNEKQYFLKTLPQAIF